MNVIVNSPDKWYKRPLIIGYISLIFSVLLLLSNCSTNTRLNLLYQKQLDIEKRISENKDEIDKLNEIVKLTVEQEFAKNLLYTDAIQKGKMSNQDIQKRFDDLSKKLNKVNDK